MFNYNYFLAAVKPLGLAQFKLMEEEVSDDENDDDSYESSHEERIDEKLKKRADHIDLNKVLLTDNGESVKMFKRKADIHSLNLKYFKENEIGKGEIKTDLQLKIKKNDDFFKKIKYKEKSNKLSKFITQYNKGKASAMLNMHLETGKKTNMIVTQTVDNLNNNNNNNTFLRSIYKKNTVEMVKPLYTQQSVRVENTNEMSTYYKQTETKESVVNTNEIRRESSKKLKLAPLITNTNFNTSSNIAGHKRVKSNWGEEIREKIPELLSNNITKTINILLT